MQESRLVSSSKTPFQNCATSGAHKRKGIVVVGQAHHFWQQPDFSFELKGL